VGVPLRMPLFYLRGPVRRSTTLSERVVTEQFPLFHEDLTEALRTCVQALGGPKKVGALLRPELPADQAGRWIADCLNPDRRDQLHPNQLLLVLTESRKVGCHAAMRYLAFAAGYQEPAPMEPQDERAALQRQFVESVRQQNEILKRFERLGLAS
jgi:hypothetical protein